MNIDNGWILREPLFNLYNPGIVAIPIGFLGAIHWISIISAKGPN